MVQRGGRELISRRGDLTVVGGDARSTATVGFGGTVLTWEDLPAASRKAAQHRAQVLATQVGVDPGLTTEGADVTQTLRGWRAHRDRLYVVVADRPMHVVPGGTVPAGGWRPVSVLQLDADGEPARRVGWVPAGVADAGAGPRSDRAATTPAHPPEQDGAAHAWIHLPAPVRAGAERSVPVPVDWLGQLTQTRQPDGGTGQALVVLRRDDRRAVVVVATRERAGIPGLPAAEQDAALARGDWLVEQITFELRAPALLEPARPGRRMPWG